jgi:hypothetical protein
MPQGACVVTGMHDAVRKLFQGLCAATLMAKLDICAVTDMCCGRHAGPQRSTHYRCAAQHSSITCEGNLYRQLHHLSSPGHILKHTEPSSNRSVPRPTKDLCNLCCKQLTSSAYNAAALSQLRHVGMHVDDSYPHTVPAHTHMYDCWYLLCNIY